MKDLDILDKPGCVVNMNETGWSKKMVSMQKEGKTYFNRFFFIVDHITTVHVEGLQQIFYLYWLFSKPYYPRDFIYKDYLKFA